MYSIQHKKNFHMQCLDCWEKELFFTHRSAPASCIQFMPHRFDLNHETNWTQNSWSHWIHFFLYYNAISFSIMNINILVSFFSKEFIFLLSFLLAAVDLMEVLRTWISGLKQLFLMIRIIGLLLLDLNYYKAMSSIDIIRTRYEI